LDASAKATKDRFFETLSSFVDPYFNKSRLEKTASDPQFSYAVKAWLGDSPTPILGDEKEFNRHMVEPMEHRIEGEVDIEGVFRGRVKAFGEWLSDEILIEPPNDLKIPKRVNVTVGPFSLFIASMEFIQQNTTHSKEEFRLFLDLAERYAG